jgi:YqaJ-like recombinase protein
MSFQIITAEQRSPAWFAARAGRLTGSRASDMLATIKSGEAAGRRDLRAQLVVERLTGEPQEDGFVNAAMLRGIEKEPEAFAAYEAATGHVVRRTGFLAHDDLLVGCSLDGDVDEFTGIVELKCPKSATHLGYLRSGKLPTAHLAQVTHNLFVTGAEWCDFASFDDRFPSHLQLFRVRVARTDVDLAAYEKAVRAFLSEVDTEVAALSALQEVA